MLYLNYLSLTRVPVNIPGWAKCAFHCNQAFKPLSFNYHHHHYHHHLFALFRTRISLNFFRLSFDDCKNCVNKCDDLSLILLWVSKVQNDGNVILGRARSSQSLFIYYTVFFEHSFTILLWSGRKQEGKSYWPKLLRTKKLEKSRMRK